MKKVWKKGWVAALLSGKYTQGTGALVSYGGTSNPEYCCLAIICKVAGMTNKKIAALAIPDRDGDLEENSMLTPDLLKKFGLTNKQQKSLASMNDSGKTFEQIAKHIDRRY